MTTTTSASLDPMTQEPPPGEPRVCPFCGLAEETNETRGEGAPCPRCMLANTSATRKATRARIGPWHVRQVRNPWAPGMKFDTLLALVKRGQVTPASIVRGPTTDQMWRRASRVKGLSREFGVCYSCGGGIERDANLCPHCNRLQEPPANPDVLLERNGEAPANPATPVRREIKAPVDKRNDERPAAAVEPAPPRRAAAPLAPSVPPDQPGDALLTAAELATAFKLDFAPSGNGNGDGAKRAAPVATKRRRFPVKRFAFVLLLVGVAVLLYLRPALRLKVMDWSQERFAAAKIALSRPSRPATTLPTVKRIERSIDTVSVAPIAKPQPAVTPPPLAPAPVVVDVPKTPAPPPAPAKVEVSGPQSSAPAPAPAVSGDPAEQAMTLWRKALDAERDQDFVEAVKCYEAIEKLPEYARPPGLKVNLELARKQAPSK